MQMQIRTATEETCKPSGGPQAFDLKTGLSVWASWDETRAQPIPGEQDLYLGTPRAFLNSAAQRIRGSVVFVEISERV